MTRATIRLLRSPTDPVDVERLPWHVVGPEFIEAWGRPNGKFEPEHLTVYGKSGSGKTHFIGEVLRLRALYRQSHVTAVITKRADATVRGWGWPIIQKWPPNYGDNQVVFWARAKGISAEHRRPQRTQVKTVMDELWRDGSNMVVYWDELTYLEQDLALKTELSTFYREGRSHGLTNVASIQRPSGVTRLAHSEAGWTVAFKPKDLDDRKRIAEIFGDRARFMAVLGSLDSTRYEFLMRHDLTGETFISHLPGVRRPSGDRKPLSAPVGYGVSSGQKGAS